MMITYCFKCECGQKIEVVRPMADARKSWKCLCGKTMTRDYKTEHCNAGDRDYSRPIVSHSLAIHPDQISEHKQKFPDIEVTKDGCPVFDNYQKHEKYLNKTGFVKL